MVSQSKDDSSESTKSFLVSTALAGAASGSIGKLMFHPIDTIKAKLQIERAVILRAKNFRETNTITQTIINVLKNEGVRGFYPGVGISVLGSAPAACLYFTAYELSKETLRNTPYFKGKENLMFFCSGMIAETVSCLIWLPIDVIKERMQVQSNLKIYSYKNSFDAIRTIMKYEGIPGLYRAYGATILSFGPFSALYFSFYENFKILISKNSSDISFNESLVISAFSGALASFITNPLDMAKLRMQVQRGEKAMNKSESGLFNYKNMFHGIYLIWKNEGFLALYKGSLARVAHSTPVTAVSISLVEKIRQFFMSMIPKDF